MTTQRGATPDTVVVGAGIIGLNVAYHLARLGQQVTVLDSGRAGWGTSRTNAGWIVPSMSAPVPSPESVRIALRSWGRPGSPLHLRPRADAGYVRFLAGLLAASTPHRFEQGRRATAAFAADAIAAFDRLAAAGVGFERHHRGVLLLFRDEQQLAAHRGEPGMTYLDATQTREVEPAVGPSVVGALRCDGDQFVDPSRLLDALEAACVANGVVIHQGASVRTLVEVAGGVRVVGTAGQQWHGRTAVICAGVQTRRLMATAGYGIPVYAGKGYGLDWNPTPVRLRHALYLTERKIAVTPLTSGLRLAGMMEFGSQDTSVASTRAAHLVNGARDYLPGCPAGPGPAWAGLRPMTPDGLPIIGPVVPGGHLWVASGHAMLGITLGPITGECVAAGITSNIVPTVLEPFSPSRFRPTPP